MVNNQTDVELNELIKDLRDFIDKKRQEATTILTGMVATPEDTAIHNMANGMLRVIVALEAEVQGFIDKITTSEDMDY